RDLPFPLRRRRQRCKRDSLQTVVATAAADLAARGIEPPMLRSGNVDGGLAWNARVFEEYGDRIFYRR
ncbi:SIS domain-containing protein, partial [Streptomyces sp. S3(2020)]|nr:SIS domain-containing protein [Streptomyces sp. S3(2020)]